MKRFAMWLWANDITTAWGGVPNATLSMMFACCPSLMFLASPWLEIYRFQIDHFADFEQFKADIDFANFGQVNTVPICFFTDCGQVTVTLLSLGKMCCEKQSKPSPFDQNSRTMHRIWLKLFSMIRSAEIKNWFPRSTNRLYLFNLLFLSVTWFFWVLP